LIFEDRGELELLDDFEITLEDFVIEFNEKRDWIDSSLVLYRIGTHGMIIQNNQNRDSWNEFY